MKFLKLLAVLIPLWLACPTHVYASASQADKDFTSLFDGKSLDGWHLMNGADFIVEEGVIKHKDGLGWLRSEKLYTDFILRIEFRFLEPKQDGGIFVRASMDGEKWPDKRYEVQIENTERMARIFRAEYDLDIPRAQEALKPLDEWNTYEIKLVGSRIEVILNGELVCTSDKLTRVEPGYIGLQGENGSHEYRNIRIKDLGTSGEMDEAVAKIREATVSFLNGLTDEQRKDCNLPFDHSDRENWKYVPAERMGLSMNRMSADQKEDLDILLRAILSSDGIEKTQGVILCETFLYERSGNSDFRDPGKYHLTVYGVPDPSEPWGLRLEGHHLSLNYTFVGERGVAAAPAFFGANPAKFPSGPKQGLRILKDEEDSGRELLLGLNSSQIEKAIFSEDAPREIFTRARPSVSSLDPVGLSYAEMELSQRKKLMSLIAEYLSWMPDAIASERMNRLVSSGLDPIRFAWAGGIEIGDQHYYRIQGPSFLIEYDNFQGDGNHIHSVWRDFNGDFGRDLLKEHYEHGHVHR